jgi:hypothetical protein
MAWHRLESILGMPKSSSFSAPGGNIVLPPEKFAGCPRVPLAFSIAASISAAHRREVREVATVG